MNSKIAIVIAAAIVGSAAIASGVIFATGGLSPMVEKQSNNENSVGANSSNSNNINTNSAPLTTQQAGIEKLEVIASFFPLYDFARHVGGDRAEVSSLVPVGIEPHDWEPTAQNIVDLQNADMFIFNGAGFEGEWIAQVETNLKVDTSTGIELLEVGQSDEHNRGGEGGEAHQEEQLGQDNTLTSTTTTAVDPHIWLDPVLAKHQVEVIRDAFIQLDPQSASYYRDNAARYISELESLDASIKSELLSSNCSLNDFIAFHDAFGYFANRYNLTQHSIQGISPEGGEILPQRIIQIKDLAIQLGIDTIYSEDLVDPRLATVIANEIPNGRVLTLSPIEGVEQEELDQGIGYIQKMRENIENLKVGLKCQ
jgi:zinc transport system substrate-binding protein